MTDDLLAAAIAVLNLPIYDCQECAVAKSPEWAALAKVVRQMSYHGHPTRDHTMTDTTPPSVWFNFRHGWLWWHVTRHLTADACRWRLARLVPRKVALLVFVRVYACTGDAPGEDYGRIYSAWEKGAGR